VLGDRTLPAGEMGDAAVTATGAWEDAEVEGVPDEPEKMEEGVWDCTDDVVMLDLMLGAVLEERLRKWGFGAMLSSGGKNDSSAPAGDCASLAESGGARTGKGRASTFCAKRG
jgi:hypothetical protein